MKRDWVDKLESLQVRIQEIQKLDDPEKAKVEADEVLIILNDLIIIFIEEIKAIFCIR